MCYILSQGATFPEDDNPVYADGSMVDPEYDPGSSSNPWGNLVFMRGLAQKIRDLKDIQDKES